MTSPLTTSKTSSSTARLTSQVTAPASVGSQGHVVASEGVQGAGRLAGLQHVARSDAQRLAVLHGGEGRRRARRRDRQRDLRGARRGDLVEREPVRALHLGARPALQQRDAGHDGEGGRRGEDRAHEPRPPALDLAVDPRADPDPVVRRQISQLTEHPP
ncbi:MAG: hypothetical protein CVU56_06420 [Deltaproteobacteria bacterium HGW-Deltaproteobacteria-14]|nr:MAG: hypothetical protein CVU56_06420 [Deltaproteobacteria bacterium HGW-Deltaproteobacteria-14]